MLPDLRLPEPGHRRLLGLPAVWSPQEGTASAPAFPVCPRVPDWPAGSRSRASSAPKPLTPGPGRLHGASLGGAEPRLRLRCCRRGMPGRHHAGKSGPSLKAGAAAPRPLQPRPRLSRAPAPSVGHVGRSPLRRGAGNLEVGAAALPAPGLCGQLQPGALELDRHPQTTASGVGRMASGLGTGAADTGVAAPPELRLRREARPSPVRKPGAHAGGGEHRSSPGCTKAAREAREARPAVSLP